MQNSGDIEEGYCQCGCGQKVTLARRNRKERNQTKGNPKRFIKNHHSRKEHNPNWKGGIGDGCNDYHRILAEKALGKPLPLRAVVHHINRIRRDNRNDNLIICQDNEYHQLIHLRTRALKTCGNANWRKCHYCKRYDNPDNLKIANRGDGYKRYYHSECHNKKARQDRPSRIVLDRWIEAIRALHGNEIAEEVKKESSVGRPWIYVPSLRKDYNQKICVWFPTTPVRVKTLLEWATELERRVLVEA